MPAPETLFDVRIGWAVALFLGLAALDHLLTATVSRGVYERDLRRGINRFRWVEYSFSATLMIILIGFYSGITSINAVIVVAGANVGMILFGWLQERMNPPGRTSTTMLPFWFGALVGLAPWISIAVNIIGSETVPGFVYGIVIAQFIFFFSFGLNQWLQYRGWAAGPTTPSARRPTWCSASWRSRCWPGRSSPDRLPPERRRERRELVAEVGLRALDHAEHRGPVHPAPLDHPAAGELIAGALDRLVADRGERAEPRGQHLQLGGLLEHVEVVHRGAELAPGDQDPVVARNITSASPSTFARRSPSSRSARPSYRSS